LARLSFSRKGKRENGKKEEEEVVDGRSWGNGSSTTWFLTAIVDAFG
jgi:hypothetical protein